jgi:hypothetical protein
MTTDIAPPPSLWARTEAIAADASRQGQLRTVTAYLGKVSTPRLAARTGTCSAKVGSGSGRVFRTTSRRCAPCTPDAVHTFAQDDYSVTGAVIAVSTLAIMQIITSYISYRVKPFRKILKGEPVVLIEDGKPLNQNLRRERITADDVSEKMCSLTTFQSSESSESFASMLSYSG